MTQTLLAILVVEDDPLVQTVVQHALEDGGFAVTLVKWGEEAVSALKEKPGHYRALVTDINILGKLDGWQVAKAAREIDPTFPIIYMSGAEAGQWSVNGVPYSVILNKPFAPAQLVTAVSTLLNGTVA